MIVNTNSLVPGCILSEDVYKKTNNPIMKKNTVLTEDDIKILKLFLVQQVNIENKLIDGKALNEKKNEGTNKKEKTSFIDQYLSAVQYYKRLFTNWQGGTKVNPYEVRKLVLPLVDLTVTKKELISLHHYCTKNEYIYYHAVAVSVLCAAVGKKMKLSRGEIIQLGIAGLLADAGMAKLPFNVFEKSGPITLQEFEEVKKHPILGYKLLEDVPGFSKGVLIAILQHHEREDGSGYPMSIKGDKIHLFSKIIAICDIYHAMTSERAYKSKQSPFIVIESLKKDNFGKIDPIILNHFIETMFDLSIGKKVLLNNGETGKIVYIDENEITRPIIETEDGELINLKNDLELHIEDMIYERQK